jgi:hypothetical protein
VKAWRARKFVADVVYDLRSRNLLLVVVMLMVGIVAVPVLLSSSSSGSAPSPIDLGAQASSQGAAQSESAVVAYHPGIRNFKKRLNDLSAKDPFVQQFTASTSSGTAVDQVTSTGSSTLGGSTSVSGGNGGGTSGSGQRKTTTQTLYTYYVTNVSVGESGGSLTDLGNITQFQFLPSQDKPVLVYLGTTSGGTQALFLVSKDVSSVGGSGTCFPTADDCQLLGLNPGGGADLVYQPDGKTYHVGVTKIKRVTSSKPPS